MKSMRFTFAGMALAMMLASPSEAQLASGWGPWPPVVGPDYDWSYHGRDPREGRVEATAFVATSLNAAELGHGSIVLAPAEKSTGSAIEDAIYGSALVDQLARAGYQTDVPAAASGQTVEFTVSRDVVQPPEPPHSPVGGAVSAGVGSHGSSGLGVALDIDLSKPLKALVATRLEARIRRSATQELLWEGRAQVVTREGDKHWTEQALAAKLAAALFKGFPRPSPLGRS
jgi:hypothetical protein